MSRRAKLLAAPLGMVLALGVFACRQLPAIGSGALLHPARTRALVKTPPACADETFAGDGVSLRGWRCAASEHARGTIVWLHGVADNHGSAAGIVARFVPRGFSVIAYDSRAHGESDGDACTYGYYEKRDLKKVADTVGAGPIILIGDSLGGAVALQEAADDARITAVVAAEAFSDLRSVATHRAPRIFTGWLLAAAFDRAAADGRFDVDAVSPVRAAGRIRIPVLLIHGEADVDTPPDNSRRIFAALAGPRRLVLVPGAAHNRSLRPEVWREIEQWIDQLPGTSTETHNGRSNG